MKTLLLNSVIIVLREVLEAVLLISVFLSGANFLNLGNRWLVASLLLGILGAVSYGALLDPVSELFDGVGQELFNAVLQFAVFVLIVAIVFLLPRQMNRERKHQTRIQAFMAIAVALAITREGAEILTYVSGFWSMNDIHTAVAIGSFIGACIGFSVGILMYYLLVSQPRRRALPITFVLLFLVAASMSSQAVRLLIQADWISAAGALWDTSSILPEQSLLGQLLYALIGYEATPSAVEVTIYVGSIFLVFLSLYAGRIFGADASGEMS
jgi:high-affinity iron transporter